MSTVSRRLGATLGSVGLAIATAAVVTAGPASAEVTKLEVKPGLDGKIATTCTYKVSATVNGTGKVYFSLLGVPIGNADPVNGVASIEWTPVVPGPNVLSAIQGLTPAEFETVTVVPGLNLGSLCFGIA